MTKEEFRKVLTGAAAGTHSDLEVILQLYMPLIDSNSYLLGQLDEDLKQYYSCILRLTFQNSASEHVRPRITPGPNFFLQEATKTKMRCVFICVRPPVLTCTLKIEQLILYIPEPGSGYPSVWRAKPRALIYGWLPYTATIRPGTMVLPKRAARPQ